MASFLSALSLVILILANSCFTLPVLNEDISTISLFNNDLTTELASLNAQVVSDDYTTVLPTLPLRRSSDEHIGFEVSTIVDNLPEENASRAPRTSEEVSTPESPMFPTEQSINNKRDHNEILPITIRPSDLTTELFVQEKRGDYKGESITVRPPHLTTERFVQEKRGDYKEESITVRTPHLTTERFAREKRGDYNGESFTASPSDLTTERFAQDKRQFSVLSLNTGRPPVLTTEESVKSKRSFSALLYDIIEPLLLTTEVAVHNESGPVDSSFITVEPSALTTEEAVKSKRGFGALLYDIVEPLLLTTDVAMNSETNSSDIAFTTVEPITQVGQIQKRNFENGTEDELINEPTTDEISTVPSSPAGKHIGHFEDDNEKIEPQELPKKTLKSQKKFHTSSTTTIPSDNNVEPEETSKDSTIPTAVFDQDASKKISNVPSDFLILDETVEIIVTDRPERLSNSTMETTKQAKPLNQGQKSADIEEKESDN